MHWVSIITLTNTMWTLCYQVTASFRRDLSRLWDTVILGLDILSNSFDPQQLPIALFLWSHEPLTILMLQQLKARWLYLIYTGMQSAAPLEPVTWTILPIFLHINIFTETLTINPLNFVPVRYYIFLLQ